MSLIAEQLEARAKAFPGSVIDSSTALLASQTHDIVRFAMGAPGGDLIPQQELDACFQQGDESRYGYGATEGEPELIDEIVALSSRFGGETSAERILITTGAMQGLDLAFKLLINSGDLVIVEGPTYTNGNSTALSYGADLLEAPVDGDGMVVERLPELVAETGKTPRAIYVIPTFQNPSGTTLSAERRQRLLELAEEWDCWIIEDDPYGLLGFDGQHVPSLAELSPGNPRIFGVRTLSKIIAPGLRVGWIDVDPKIRELAIAAKQAMDTCSSVPIQQAVARFLQSGALTGHLERLRGIYRERRDAMRDAVTEIIGDDARTTHPEGGMFLWVTLEGRYSDIDTEAMFERALKNGVAYIPGPAFSANGRYRNQLRVCFATSTPERIREGIRRLRTTLDEELA